MGWAGFQELLKKDKFNIRLLARDSKKNRKKLAPTIIVLLASSFVMSGWLTDPRVLSPSITVKQAVRVILSSMPTNAAFLY